MSGARRVYPRSWGVGVRASFEFKLLGPLQVVAAGGCAVPVPAAKQRVVLASLLVDPGRVVTVDQLITRLWGNAVPDGAQGTLRSYVMRLRQALNTTSATGPIVTCPEGYCIDLAGDVLDLHRFEALVRQARTATAEGRADRASALLSDALGLWRGEPLSNVPSEVLHREVLPRLAEQWLLARELRIDTALAVGRHQDMTAELGELTTHHPLRERFWGQRMLALYRSGRQAEALECYHTLSTLLAGELGIGPGPELRFLHQAILTNDLSLRSTLPDRRPELVELSSSRGAWRLAQDLELLERERELQALDGLIVAACQGSGQLVTVEGAAGVGKTRLLAAARAHAQRTGMRVLAARGSALEREFAYGVVRQLFEPALAGADRAERNDLLAGAARPAAVLLDQIDAAATVADRSFALLHGLFWLTANLAQTPLMLVIDDLHWSDSSSLRFLAYLMPRLDGLPLLVVTALRPAEPAVDQDLMAQVITDGTQPTGPRRSPPLFVRAGTGQRGRSTSPRHGSGPVTRTPPRSVPLAVRVRRDPAPEYPHPRRRCEGKPTHIRKTRTCLEARTAHEPDVQPDHVGAGRAAIHATAPRRPGRGVPHPPGSERSRRRRWTRRTGHEPPAGTPRTRNGPCNRRGRPRRAARSQLGAQ